ncbi:hypothetical protein D3C83_51020 [compost metagenome]
MGGRCAEQHHDRITHEFVDGTAVPENDLTHFPQIPVQECEDDSGGVGLRNRGEAAQVREQNGDLAAHEVFSGRGCGGFAHENSMSDDGKV